MSSKTADVAEKFGQAISGDPESSKKFFTSMAHEYRQRCLSVPGVNSLHAMVRAWFETKLKDEANVLVCACGGGAEVDALAPSERRFRIVGFDTSEAMLEVAKATAEQHGAPDRGTFILGTLDAVPTQPLFDAATSILIMHFFSDKTGAKLEFLRGIRSRLRDGAPIALVDMSCSDEELIRLGPVWVQHARNIDAELGKLIEQMLPSLMAFENRITPQRTEQLLTEAGFTNVTPFFRGLWYTGWFAEAGSV
eukprot:TRINITY_DN3191_c0_g1_i2.p1 TRINITY_DN3191_c0_g1~~TRINITY_DN3191_c0_g1_i2.p1  ORF type:complete len:283 (+),score=81.02 TRINITY_DN3191_c0_g1_i2:99-851(+)